MMIGKDPKLALSKSGTLFISYLTAAAHEIAAKSGQKTITVNHVQAALEAIGFGEWADPLMKRIEKFNAMKASKKDATGEASLDAPPATDDNDPEDEEAENDGMEDYEDEDTQNKSMDVVADDDDQLESKRPKLDDILAGAVSQDMEE